MFQKLAMIYLPWHRHEPWWVFVLLCQSVVDFGTNVKFPWSGGFLDFQHGIQISNSVIIATVTPHSLENFAITPFSWKRKVKVRKLVNSSIPPKVTNLYFETPKGGLILKKMCQITILKFWNCLPKSTTRFTKAL